MNIIEKIEISYFRSFGEKSIKIENLKDLNIFSGSNDAGKSNVLKALNLFFNDEINIWEKFDIDKDLSIWQKEKSNKNKENKKINRTENDSHIAQRDLFVKIKIFFRRTFTNTTTTPEEFWVSKKWYRNGRFKIEDNIKLAYKKKNDKEPTPRELSAQHGQLTQFLNSINFEYIPAVKDREFFKHLFSKLQKSLLERDNNFKTYSKQINQNIASITSDLFKEFKDKTGVQAQFETPVTLIDFFTKLGVSTEKGISLFSRGDGIQARFIPEILNEISKGKKYVIWGFEEPENSYEYRSAENLANDFLKIYSMNKQIFLTSHTKEFLSLIKNNESRVSLHRVFKSPNKGSIIETYNEGFNKDKIQKDFWEDILEKDRTSEQKDTLNKIFEDIGFIETDQYLIENLENQLRNQRKILDKTNISKEKKDEIISRLSQRIEKSILNEENLKREIEEYNKPLVFVEDANLQVYQIAWLKLNDKSFTKESFKEIFKKECPFIIYPKKGRVSLNKYLDEAGIDEKIGKKICGIFDFDEAYIKDFNGLDQTRWEIEDGSRETCLIRKRKDHECYYALMIPVPPSRFEYVKGTKHTYLTMEHLFEDSFLKDINCYDGFDTPAGSLEITKIKRKNVLWKELLDKEKHNFKNFKPLFDKISLLFKL